MSRDRFVSFGLLMAAAGWVAMVADAVLSPQFASPGNMVSVAAMRSDIFTVSETTICSGFALAILGTLRSGFGGLNRFFKDVLDRAGAPRPAPVVTAYAEPPPVSLEPQVIQPAADPMPRPAPAKNYTVLANGAVEVETLLGTRVFASLDEARGFIR